MALLPLKQQNSSITAVEVTSLELTKSSCLQMCLLFPPDLWWHYCTWLTHWTTSGQGLKTVKSWRRQEVCKLTIQSQNVSSERQDRKNRTPPKKGLKTFLSGKVISAEWRYNTIKYSENSGGNVSKLTWTYSRKLG